MNGEVLCDSGIVKRGVNCWRCGDDSGAWRRIALWNGSGVVAMI